jgi:hypothetical protein
MLYLASQGKTFLLCQNSVSTKNSSPAQSFIFTSKIPKHIIPSVQTTIDTHTCNSAGNDISYKEFSEIIPDAKTENCFEPSITQPFNKAPPTA